MFRDPSLKVACPAPISHALPAEVVANVPRISNRVSETTGMNDRPLAHKAAESLCKRMKAEAISKAPPSSGLPPRKSDIKTFCKDTLALVSQILSKRQRIL
jgi:hypothetical protein